MAAARRQAVPTDLAEWEEGLPDSFLMCRDMGHTWKPYTAAWEPEENAYRRVLKCPRCRTLRTQWISPSGHLAGNGSAYTYPDGYAAPKGVGRLDGGGRDHLRLLSVLRAMDKAGNVRPLRRAG